MRRRATVPVSGLVQAKRMKVAKSWEPSATRSARFRERAQASRFAGLAGIGCAAFAVGLLVYLTDRVGSRALLVPALAALTGSNLFGALGQWLPSFVHPFSFSLFTAAALPPASAPRHGACVAWGVVNVAFELGQHPQVSASLAELLQGGLRAVPLSQALARYFTDGTFDSGDIVAALLGALAASAVLQLVHRDLEHNHAQ